MWYFLYVVEERFSYKVLKRKCAVLSVLFIILNKMKWGVTVKRKLLSVHCFHMLSWISVTLNSEK